MRTWCAAASRVLRRAGRLGLPTSRTVEIVAPVPTCPRVTYPKLKTPAKVQGHGPAAPNVHGEARRSAEDSSRERPARDGAARLRATLPHGAVARSRPRSTAVTRRLGQLCRKNRGKVPLVYTSHRQPACRAIHRNNIACTSVHTKIIISSPTSPSEAPPTQHTIIPPCRALKRRPGNAWRSRASPPLQPRPSPPPSSSPCS